MSIGQSCFRKLRMQSPKHNTTRKKITDDILESLDQLLPEAALTLDFSDT